MWLKLSNGMFVPVHNGQTHMSLRPIGTSALHLEEAIRFQRCGGLMFMNGPNSRAEEREPNRDQEQDRRAVDVIKSQTIEGPRSAFRASVGVSMVTPNLFFTME
jgi:hypothetical protein